MCYCRHLHFVVRNIYRYNKQSYQFLLDSAQACFCNKNKLLIFMYMRTAISQSFSKISSHHILCLNMHYLKILYWLNPNSCKYHHAEECAKYN